MKFLKDFFLLLLLALVGVFAGGLLSAPALLVFGADSSLGLIITQWITCICMFFIPAIVWCLLIKKENPWVAFKFTKPSQKAVLLAIAFALVSVPFGSATAQWIEYLPFPQFVRDYVEGQLVMQLRSVIALMGGYNASLPYKINAILLVGVVTGIVEETMFRGAIRKLFSDRLGVHGTAILVGLIFSIIHFEFYGFLWRWFLGSFYVYLVYYSGSIWTSIIAHALNNSVAVIITYCSDFPEVLPSSQEEWLALAKSQDTDMPVWIVAISTVATVAVLYYFWKNRESFKNNLPQIEAE